MYNGKRGQSLLVIVLLISVVFTLVATASYRFTTETQTSKLQEESVRTLAAADSGIERGLQIAASQASYSQNFTQAFLGTNVTLDGINKTASTIDIAKTQERTFVTSTIDKDEQYLFYLYDYPSGTNYYRNNFKQMSQSATCPVRGLIVIRIITIRRTSNGVRKPVFNKTLKRPHQARTIVL